MLSISSPDRVSFIVTAGSMTMSLVKVPWKVSRVFLPVTPYLKMKLKSDFCRLSSATPFAVGILSQPVKLKNRLDEIRQAINKKVFFISSPGVRLRQLEIAPRVRCDFFLFPGGDMRGVVLDEAHLPPHVSPVAFIEIE